jgi:hypothetical protein
MAGLLTEVEPAQAGLASHSEPQLNHQDKTHEPN